MGMGKDKNKYFQKKFEKKLDNPLSLVRMWRVIENDLKILPILDNGKKS